MKKNLIVFDMDGVIIDVSESYRDVVRHTASLFFQPAKGADKLPEPLFEPADLAAVKQSGGLNNDWDLTYLVIKLLFSVVDIHTIQESLDPWTRYRENIRRCDVAPLAAYLRSTDNPLTSLLKQYGKLENEFIKSLHVGDVGSGNIIKQVFQEIYLGADLFRSTYHLDPAVYRGEGFILRERVLIDRQILAELSKNNVLAVATGRPKAEAEYPLKHYQLNDFFSLTITLDDCLMEEKRILAEEGRTVSLSKPDPFMLDAIARAHREPFDCCYYIGDMPDDMLAAARSASKYKGIGLLLAAPDKSSLKKQMIRAGADYVVDDFDALKQILL
ncbi:MAG: HAD hydrolase-like protein [Desulfobacterales bacterium]|nr:MAG: HAD hydrolase-like protein [Desulfobacterales bacterium]